MSRHLSVLFLLVSVPGLAQTPDPRGVEELRAIRATLEKLEQGQQTLIALLRIANHQARLAVLEARRLQILTSELELTGENAVASPTQPSDAGPQPALLSLRPDGQTEVAPMRPGQANTGPSRDLLELRRERQTLETSIAALKAAIADLEKSLATTR